MMPAKIDYIFPYFIFFYGIIWIFATESGLLTRGMNKVRTGAKFNATGRILESLHAQLMAHEALAWLCFWVGGLWSLQNLVF